MKTKQELSLSEVSTGGEHLKQSNEDVGESTMTFSIGSLVQREWLQVDQNREIVDALHDVYPRERNSTHAKQQDLMY